MPANGQALTRSLVLTYERGATEPTHTHDEHQLVYASHGLLSVDTASSRWLVPPLRALWVPAGVPHSIIARATSEMATLYFGSTVALTARADVTVISVTPLLRELIRSIQLAPATGDVRSHLEAVIIDQLEGASSSPTLELPRLHDERTRAVAELLDANPADRRTLRELGAEVGASERTLQRLFAAETGSTFGRWRTQLRLQHGVVALGEGLGVSAAAARSGYQEPSAFIAAFRAAFGTTPSRYFID